MLGSNMLVLQAIRTRSWVLEYLTYNLEIAKSNTNAGIFSSLLEISRKLTIVNIVGRIEFLASKQTLPTFK